MNTSSANWRLRIGFGLATICGLGWGLLLGWFQIRVNAWLSPWLVVGAGLPVAFGGSMLIGLAFNRMLLAWPKFARWLIALFIIMLALPFGYAWGLLENGYNPIQLWFESKPETWYFEWLFVAMGLLAGMLPRWTLPFLRPVGRFFDWLFDKPLNFLEWLGNLPLRLIAAIKNFFVNTWRTINAIPHQLFQFVARPFHHVSTQEQIGPPPPPAETLTPPPQRARRATKRKTQAKPVAVANENNRNSAPHITGIVEDRCPYCFDIVKKQDPRGVKKCQVCGAPHHADCWAITGKCQVPHLNT